MATLIKDWWAMGNGTGKRHAYYASREWAVLKEAVKERSGGVCERCKKAPGESVHHQTYERLYAETLEDLLHTCGPCHEFISGKSKDDPAAQAGPVITFMGRVTKSVALLGTQDRADVIPAAEVRNGPQYPEVLKLRLGPPPDHGFVSSLIDNIVKSNLIFGWFDPFSHMGTILELGYASGIFAAVPEAKNRDIVIGCPEQLMDSIILTVPIFRELPTYFLHDRNVYDAWIQLWNAPEWR